MTSSLSIFLKVCPACAGKVSTSAAQCDCGHVFETSQAVSEVPEESTLRDEELYENYLQARAEQARQSADAARRVAEEEPDSHDKAGEAELALEVARSIEADLAEQQKKIKALRRLVEVKRRPSVSANPARERSAPLPAAGKREIPTRAPNVAALPEIEPVVEIVAVPVVPDSPSPAPVVTSPVASTEKAAQVLSAIKKAKAREDRTRERKARESRRRTSAPTAPSETIVKATPPSPVGRDDAVILATPPDQFRELQAARAEQALEVQKRADRKDCPNCTASVPLTTTRCSCGFAFVTGGNDLPTLTLCTGDFTALRDSLNLHLRRP